jgi:hypothetical protein
VDLAKYYVDRGEALRERIMATAGRRCNEVLQLPAFIQSNMNLSWEPAGKRGH